MSALQIAVRYFIYPIEAFLRLLVATNNFGFYYAVFTLAVVFRLLIVPIIGHEIRGSGSDTAKQPRSKSDNGKRVNHG